MSPYYRALRERMGTELLLIPAVAAVIRDEHGRILIQRSRHGVWSLPAGAIEPGESPAQAAVRLPSRILGPCFAATSPARILTGTTRGFNP